MSDIAMEVALPTKESIMRQALEPMVLQAMGQASMCWENVGGAGEFDSTQAREVGDGLVRSILKLYAKE